MKKYLFLALTTLLFFAAGLSSCDKEPVTPDVEVTEVRLDQPTLALEPGGEATLTATVLPEEATDKTVTWTSSNEAAAKVVDGKVTAIAVGKATITAKAGKMTATCEVTVAESVVAVESISLAPTTLALEPGGEATLTATVLPNNATDATVTYTSATPTVATVDAAGKVTAVAVGHATITAQAGDKTATCEVTVAESVVPVESISLAPTTLALEVGKTGTIKATVLPETATDKTVTWTSAAPTIAKVDAAGKVTAVAKGTAVITAKAGAKTATCTVTVTQSTVVPGDNFWAASNIVWVPDTSLPDGGKLTFAATPADNATIPANVQGLLFKYGSLIAVNATSLYYNPSLFPSGNLIYNPINGKPIAFLGIPQEIDQDPSSSIEISEDDFANYNGGTGFNEQAGKGDICRLISAKGWVAGSWRLPTGQEAKDLYDGTPMVNDVDKVNPAWPDDIFKAAKGAVYGSFVVFNPNATPLGKNEYGDYGHGFYLMPSGRIMGSAPSAEDDISAPVSGTFLPASGYRNRDGNNVGVGVSGYFWTSSTYKQWGWNYYTSLYNIGVGTQAPDSQAYTIRCVRAE